MALGMERVSWPTVIAVLVILVVLGMIAGGRFRKPLTG